MEITGERQVAPTLEGIRRDHVARYEWAAKLLPPGSRVADFACGVGYGTQVLADSGHRPVGFDRSDDALAYARHYYGRGTQFCRADGSLPDGGFSAVVCFETIEHVEDPAALLRSFSGADMVLASVPNENVIPFGGGFAFHHRHYTKAEFDALLRQCGWAAREWWGQAGDESEVERDVSGRTLIAVCEPLEKVAELEPQRYVPKFDLDDGPVPEHVAIIGLGPSAERFVDSAKRAGGKHAVCDEVWGINAIAGVLMCDRVFHMDDVRVQERRAQALPESNIARMLEWLRLYPGPIYTSRSHEEYPGTVDYPLEDVLNTFPNATGYFNGTAAYAVAYAIYLGVRKISLYGIDFTYPNAHHAERGRACVEYWLGVASERGIELRIPKESSLMDALYSQADRFYGYDTLDMTIRNDNGKARIDFVPRQEFPTAEEIERRYDHSVHPNALVSER